MANVTYFKLGKLPNDYQTRIQRQSTLYRLNGWIPKSDQQIYGQILQAIKLWRSRVSELESDNQICSIKALFMKNCKPAFVAAYPNTRLCKINWLCPFCYARRTSRLMEDLENILLTTTKIPVTSRSIILDAEDDTTNLLDEFDLITKKKKFDIGLYSSGGPKVYPSAESNSEDWLYYMMRRASESYRDIYNRSVSAAGLLRTSYIDITEDSYNMIHKEIWLVKKNSRLSDEKVKDLAVYSELTRKQLLKICSWFCAYQASLLTSSYDAFIPVWKFYNSQVSMWEADSLARIRSNKVKACKSITRFGLFRKSRKSY